MMTFISEYKVLQPNSHCIVMVFGWFGLVHKLQMKKKLELRLKKGLGAHTHPSQFQIYQLIEIFAN